MGEACRDDEALEERMTYEEVLADVKRLIQEPKQEYQPRTIQDLLLIKQYVQQLLKPDPKDRMNRIEASYLVARSSHEFNDGKTLA